MNDYETLMKTHCHRKKKFSEKILFKCFFDHHKSHMD
jgi:hypothetical protein